MVKMKIALLQYMLVFPVPSLASNTVHLNLLTVSVLIFLNNKVDWGNGGQKFPLVYVQSFICRVAVSIFFCPYSPVCEMFLVKPESLHPYLFQETSHSHFTELGVNTTFTKSNLNVAGILSDKETREITASNKQYFKRSWKDREYRKEEQRENGQCSEVTERKLKGRDSGDRMFVLPWSTARPFERIMSFNNSLLSFSKNSNSSFLRETHLTQWNQHLVWFK